MKNFMSLAGVMFASIVLVLPVQAEDDGVVQSLNEARLEGQLWSAFALNQHLSAFDISVDVEGSNAVLTGEVEESVQKDLAEEIALGMNGIDRVDNRLTVVDQPTRGRDRSDTERGFGDRVSDATTTATVKSKLLWNRNTGGLAIEVSTENGTVTLGGEADSEASKELAGRLARNTNGVHAVNNNIQVTGSATGMAATDDESRDFGDAVSDTWITTKVQSTLLFSRGVPGTGISVETHDGVVTLAGEVDTDAERQRAVALAGDIRGVKRVSADGLRVNRS